MSNLINIANINNINDLNTLINNSNKQYILCDFYADWCGPCKNIEKLLPDIYLPYNNNFEFIKINIENEFLSDVVDNCNITKIPTFVILECNDKLNIIDKITTSNTQELKNFVNKNISLDLDDTSF